MNELTNSPATSSCTDEVSSACLQASPFCVFVQRIESPSRMPLPLRWNSTGSATFSTTRDWSFSVRKVRRSSSTSYQASLPNFAQNVYTAALGNLNKASSPFLYSEISVPATVWPAEQSPDTYFTFTGTKSNTPVKCIGMSVLSSMYMYTERKDVEDTNDCTISTSKAARKVLPFEKVTNTA